MAKYTEDKGSKTTGNNLLLVILGILLLIVIGFVVYVVTKKPTYYSLVKEAETNLVLENDSVSKDTLETLVEEAPIIERPVIAQPTVKPTDSASVVAPQPEEKAQVVPQPEPVVASGGTEYSYKVKRGDTMFKLVSRFNNSVETIQSLNGMSDLNLKADQTLKLKIKGTHAVKPGDGLNAIAVQYGVSKERIQKANELKGESLKEGVVLIIPLP